VDWALFWKRGQWHLTVPNWILSFPWGGKMNGNIEGPWGENGFVKIVSLSDIHFC
jgi:hypothetical protein